jgi:PAS domain S-box-containing protein
LQRRCCNRHRAFQINAALAVREQALKESENRFRDFAEAASDHQWEMDENFAITQTSEGHAKVSTHKSEEVLGQPLWRLAGFDESNLDSHWWNFHDTLRAHQPFREFRYFLIAPDGKTQYLRANGNPVFDALGRFSGYRCTTRDETVEVEARHLARVAENRFQALFTHNPEPVWVIDLETSKFLEVNETAIARYGYSREEFLALRVSDIEVAEERRELSGKLPNDSPPAEEGECQHRTRVGDKMSVQVSGRQIDFGGRRASLAVVHDVTRRKQAEEQLRQSQKLEALGQLTGGIAHDFNNMLTIILGSSELLEERQDKVNADNVQLLRNIISAAQQAATLTQRLLAFARKQPLAPRATDLNELIGGFKALLRRTLGEDVNIKMTLHPDLPKVNIDGHQFESAVLNLAINARDAMPDGGSLIIDTSLATIDDAMAARAGDMKPGRYLLLSVADTGEGMTPDILAHALEPFFTTKPMGKGTGLGLSMVYGFVKQSGGQLALFSEPGLGTTVRLYLPLAESDMPTTVAAGQVRLPRGSETILVVEDEPALRALVTGMLRAMGYRILEAGNGQEALAVLAREPAIDLLFTDVVMPGGMHGRALAQEVKKSRPDLPVLYTSGYTQDTMVHQGKLDEGVELLNKPYRRRDLALKVREILDRPACRA